MLVSLSERKQGCLWALKQKNVSVRDIFRPIGRMIAIQALQDRKLVLGGGQDLDYNW